MLCPLERSANIPIALLLRGPLRHYELAHLLSNIEKLPVPFWAVSSSLSGTQPEISLGRSHPLVEKDEPSVFVASSPQPTFRRSSQAEGEGSVPGPLRLDWRRCPTNFHSRQTRIFAGSSARAALGIGPSCSEQHDARSHDDY